MSIGSPRSAGSSNSCRARKPDEPTLTCHRRSRPECLDGCGQLVDALVNRGYLARSVDEQDRRRLVVTLTERGRAAAATQAAAREQVDSQLLARVGPQCFAQARVALMALTEMAGWDDIPAEDDR